MKADAPHVRTLECGGLPPLCGKREQAPALQIAEMMLFDRERD